jgi:serine/threonine protein phosphatase 1
MRILAIGDVHGCLRAFTTLLAAVAPRPTDLIVTLGDYVDRGPDSRGVLDELIRLHRTSRLIALRGNHDQMMQEARDRTVDDRWMWLSCGGRQTLASYGLSSDEDADLDQIPESHWQFLDDVCVDWYETERHFFVHASVHPEVPLADQPTYMLLWEKLYEPVIHVSGKVMVCGHTKQNNGVPLDLGPTVCIDTGAYANNGWLTCLDVLARRYWQANQRGELRTGVLELRGEDDGDDEDNGFV